jgi:amidase
LAVFEAYECYDGCGLAELIRRGEVSAAEVCEAAIERIDQRNPRINAVVARLYDFGRAELSSLPPGAPLQGVPFLLKDLLSALAGYPLTCGSKALRNFLPDHDSELVARYRRAGLVILGKTNTSEFGINAYTEPELFGPARNPWDLDRTPGGSSGGAAAAVAAGLVPIAGGGDGGGSIRIPASYCGLFGLKPSRGRTPTGPDYGEYFQGAVVEHVITRSVRDSAAVLDAVAGADAGAPYVAAPPARPFLEETHRDPRRLRIAFDLRSPIDTPVQPEHEKAVLKAAVLLQKLGHDLEEARPDLDGAALAHSYVLLLCAEVAAEFEEMAGRLGRNLRADDVEAGTWIVGVIGRSIPGTAFSRARRLWGKAGRAMGRFHRTYDLYLTPATAQPPARIGELEPDRLEVAGMKMAGRLGLGRALRASGLFDRAARRQLARTPFTQLANLTGQPAMSVPLHWTDRGLPCGVHFTAPIGDEATLFQLAGQLEREAPWSDRRPGTGSNRFEGSGYKG